MFEHELFVFCPDKGGWGTLKVARILGFREVMEGSCDMGEFSNKLSYEVGESDEPLDLLDVSGSGPGGYCFDAGGVDLDGSCSEEYSEEFDLFYLENTLRDLEEQVFFPGDLE